MSLAVEPLKFLGRILLAFLGFFVFWLLIGSAYTAGLAVFAELVVSIVDRPTSVWSSGTTLFFWPRGYQIPGNPPSIAAEWIHANTVLLLALMIATPAPSWNAKSKRLSVALLLLLLWQVLDVVLAIEFGYATRIDPQAYSARFRYRLALLTDLAMYVDTQVVPFMIWAGIHFRQLLSIAGRARRFSQANGHQRGHKSPARAHST
ncbi:MAG: hypothetical protein N3C12_11885 [Candidatus Binatia bacterium]|nr:hypothetical protein [Candidatus Binatia bacterium]